MAKKEKEGYMSMTGVVIEALPNAMFNVKCDETELVVLATLSGVMRQQYIRILPGDSVNIDVSAYDTTRGRITYRR